MQLAPDKLLHLKLGAVAAAALVVLAVVATFTVSGAVALGSVVLGIGYELQQKIRGEGEPSWQDAAATAVPGCSIALVMFMAGL